MASLLGTRVFSWGRSFPIIERERPGSNNRAEQGIIQHRLAVFMFRRAGSSDPESTASRSESPFLLWSIIFTSLSYTNYYVKLEIFCQSKMFLIFWPTVTVFLLCFWIFRIRNVLGCHTEDLRREKMFECFCTAWHNYWHPL